MLHNSLLPSSIPSVLHSNGHTSTDFVLYEVTNELHFPFKKTAKKKYDTEHKCQQERWLFFFKTKQMH
jgi:hypothetical protein